MRRRKYKIEIGEKFYWSDRNLYHIVNMFNDEDEEFVVMKTYVQCKKNWVYEVVSMDLLKWWFGSGCFKELNK